MNYTNAVIIILATCYFVNEVNAQKGRQKWRRPKLGRGRRHFGQVNNPNRGPGTNARAKTPGNRVQIIDPTGVWSPGNRVQMVDPTGVWTPGNRVQMVDPTGVWTPGNRVQIIDPTDPNARAAAVNNGRMSNAMTIQNEVVRQELSGAGNSPMVIIDPTQQMAQPTTGTEANENTGKGKGRKSTVRKNRNGKMGGRRLKNKAKKRKIKKLTQGKKHLKKQQKLLKAEKVDQVSVSVKESKKQKRVANKWMKRRQKMLNRMRARKAKLDKKQIKKAELVSEKQHVNEVTAKNAESVKISPVVKDGANVPIEIDRKAFDIPEPIGMSDSNKNKTATNNFPTGSEDIGSSTTVNGSRIQDTSFAVSNSDSGPSNFDFGVNTGTSISNNMQNGPSVNSGTFLNLETQGNQNIEPNAGNAVFVRPVVPGFEGIEPMDKRGSQWQAGVTGQEIDIPAFLAPANSDGLLPSDNSERTGQGVPLGPFDPRTGVLPGTEETRIGGSLRFVDAQTGVLLGPADIGMSNFIGPIDPRTGVLRAPFGPGDSGIDASLEQIDNRKDTTTASVALSESSTANTPKTINGKTTNMVDVGTGFPIEPGSLLSEVKLDSENIISDFSAGPMNMIENRHSSASVTSDIPLGPVNVEMGIQREPIDNNNAALPPINSEADVQESTTSNHFEVETPASSSGLSGNNIGEAVGQIGSSMEGIPLAPIELGAGNPLGTAEIDTQNNAEEPWFDPSFGSSQAAVLQSVDLSDFFSTGEVNFLQTDPVPPSQQPEPRRNSGIQTVNGEIMPVAGQSSGVPAVGASRTKPDTSSLPSNSLLGFVFDISRALRPG